MFGGGFFGKAIPLKGGQPGNSVPMGAQGPSGQPLGVVPQGQTTPINAPRAAAPGGAAQTQAQPASFQQAPLIPPTKVPMGSKKDCPVCRG